MPDYPLVPVVETPTHSSGFDSAAVSRAVAGVILATATFAAKLAGGIAGTAAGLMAAPFALFGRRAASAAAEQDNESDKPGISATEGAATSLVHEVPTPHEAMAPIPQAVQELQK